MVGMPSKPPRSPSTHSNLDSLLRKQKIGHAPVSSAFGGNCYSDNNRQDIAKTLTQAARRSKPSPEQLDNALSAIEDVGTEYLASIGTEWQTDGGSTMRRCRLG